MTAHLQVVKVEERRWLGRQGAQAAKRLHCIDKEMTFVHFIQVSAPLDSPVKEGQVITLKVSGVRQWADGTITFQGDIEPASTK